MTAVPPGSSARWAEASRPASSVVVAGVCGASSARAARSPIRSAWARSCSGPEAVRRMARASAPGACSASCC
ncbi:hypothetical protein ACFQZC_08380 [Streptacidiphilus monticola]